MDFLFHGVTESEKQEIKKQAKEILDDFSAKLATVGKEIKETQIERKEGERREGEAGCSENFSREIMFDNAPDKSENFIIGEKKGW